jgi:hypothetical protein
VLAFPYSVQRDLLHIDIVPFGIIVDGFIIPKNSADVNGIWEKS